MRVVFLGHQTWGRVALEALLKAGHDVPLVLTHPRTEHPYETIWSDSVAEFAASNGIPCVERTYANDAEAADLIARGGAELLVSSNWRTWVSPQIYQLVPHGAINVHDGLLPRYGGFAPLNWAVVNGETEVGVTVHFMTDEFDLGDIIEQRRVQVGPTDTSTDLYHRTLPLIGELTVSAVRAIENGTVTRTPQDPAEATFFHKRARRDSLIDWTREAEEICCLVRAQSPPYPAAYTSFRGADLEVLAASVSERPYGGTPGRIFCRAEGGVAIVAGSRARTGHSRAVVLHEVRLGDGDPVKATEFFRRMGGYLGTED